MTNETATAAFARKLRLQRLAMGWERIWSALNAPLLVLGIALIIVASGVLPMLGQMVRYAVIAAVSIAFIVSLRGLFRLSWPSAIDAMRRMEKTAGLPHRKVSSAGEDIAPEFQSAEAAELWAEHKRRQWADLHAVPVSPPVSAWRSFDPRALRVPVALGVLASLLLGPGDLRSNLTEAAATPVTTPEITIAMDAWLKPPPYTGKPPVLLTSPAMQQKFASGEGVTVPANASFTVRVTGAKEPAIRFLPLDGGAPLNDIAAKINSNASGFTAETKLAQSARIEISDGEAMLATWPITIIPDLPPSVAWAKEPTIETGGSLSLNWQAKDDYGVRSITSDVSLADNQKDGIGFATDGPFLYEPPKFPVRLKKSNAKDETGKSTQDLTAHPWAGLNVTVTLTAKDAANQESQPVSVDVSLPEKVFVRPLAQALIEQRKILVLDPDKATDIARTFRVILLYPQGLTDRSGYLIRLSALATRLENSASNDDIVGAVADLWQLALDIEDGTLADAKAELEALKKQLEEALRNGASEEEIAKLTEKMRDAMERYLQAMREQWNKERQQGRNPRDPSADQQGRELSQRDLQRMLDEIERLSKNGQKDEAQALLEELNRMLQNLQPGERQQAGEGDPMGEMMDQLSDMMRQQQRLMDQTQRMPGQGQQPGEGEQGQDGQQPGEGQMGEGQGQGQGQGQNGRGLADRQGALRDLLDQMQKGLGGETPGEFGDAGRAMGEAERSLRNGDREGALQRQADALDALRKGARELGRRMREQGQGQARNTGRDGQGGGRDDDPLGRPRATQNYDEGPEKDMVPSELAIRRAREILEQLRNRANGQGLTESERGYIDRLLRGLY